MNRVPPRPCSLLLVALLVSSAVPARVSAHEYWLAPSRYNAAAGDSLRLGAFVGTGFRGEARPFAARRTVRFLARGAALVDLSRGAENGALTWGRWTAADDHGTLVAYASDFVAIDLPAPEFERYLALEGLAAVARERARTGASRKTGRERYRRACKSWIAGPRASDEGKRRATAALGLPLEIVPSETPGRRERLTLEVRYAGRPLAGALVRAWRQPLATAAAAAAGRDSVGVRSEGRTDARGLVTLRLEGAGEWLVSTVHMVPAQDRTAADWESTWASLTFVAAPR